MLPDNVLLDVFDFYRSFYLYLDIWKWHLLVHVCQRWRQLVFASPRRLNLRILYTHRTPIGNLDIWSAFPIIVDSYSYSGSSLTPNDEDNLIAALKYPDRLCGIRIVVTDSQLEKMAAVMQKPFPVLKRFEIISDGGNTPALPADFLGGSAPCLRYIHLHGIPFPALPTLLSPTCDHLVTLKLCRIPSTGYISPEAMVACLAALPRLNNFTIRFQSATSHPYRIHPLPMTRTDIPSLSVFRFRGSNEYLEDLLARIDSPQLVQVEISYLNWLVDSQVTQLSKFVRRSVGPELNPFRPVPVRFFVGEVNFTLYRHTNYPGSDRHPAIMISCEASGWPVSHMAQVLGQFSATLSTVVHLELLDELEDDSEGRENVQWLDFLRQFTTVETLRVKRGFARDIALALEVTAMEMIAGVLPSLELICLEGQPASSVEKFVIARQMSGRPVTVIDTTAGFRRTRLVI